MGSDFFGRIVQREEQLSCGAMKLPCCFYDSTALFAAFTASTARVAKLLPDPDLHPVEIWRGRALVSVSAFEHRLSDIGSYGELIVGPLVVFGRRAVPLFDAIGAIFRRNVGIHVLHMPVTTELALAAGIEVYGYPKTLADVAFTRGTGLSCSVAQGGKQVLKLDGESLPAAGSARMKVRLYSTKEGALLEAPIELNLFGLAQSRRRGAATLTLGPDHPIATSLASLDLEPRAVLLQTCPKTELILYPPHPAHVPMRRTG